MRKIKFTMAALACLLMLFSASIRVEACEGIYDGHECTYLDYNEGLTTEIVLLDAPINSSEWEHLGHFGDFVIETAWEFPYDVPQIYITYDGSRLNLNDPSLPNELVQFAMFYVSEMTPPVMPRQICCGWWRTVTDRPNTTSTTHMLLNLSFLCIVETTYTTRRSFWDCRPHQVTTQTTRTVRHLNWNCPQYTGF
jgi:hypothetical protein